MNLIEVARENLEKFGEYASLVFEDREYSNVDIQEKGNRLAGGLRKLGLERGDKVVVSVPNCPEVLVSYSAVLKIGGVVIPVLFVLQADEVRYILENSGAKAIITSEELADKIKKAAEGVGTVEHVICMGKKETPGTVWFERLVEESPADEGIEEMSEDDLAVILYTSGTTGKPKGVMLTHNNLYMNARGSTASLTMVTKDTVSLVVLPLAHAYGLTVMIGGFMLGGKGILVKWFDTEAVFRLIEKYRVEIMTGVPTMYAYMLNHPGGEKYDLSSMKVWLCAAAPLPMEVYRAFEEKFPGKIYEGYGLTEAAPAVSVHYDTKPIKPGSVGLPIETVRVEIMDEENNVLPRGEAGEICVSGPVVMKGYYRMPEETAQTIVDGWLHTGDMGKMDEDGYLYVVDRKKDMIIRGGLNIYPKDVEDVLMKHPEVVDAAVVGVKDPLMGEQVKAFVVRKYKSVVSEEEIISFCQERLAKYKTPKYVEFVSYLPKNVIGKVLKKELRGR
ncbi:MAG: long-chain fatty acid--CoA ligase [bacterium]